MQASTATGRAGEFLASFILEGSGIEVHHVSRHGADLWCKMPSGRILTVDVKSASRVRRDKQKSPRYVYHTPKTVPVDYYAFVALDRRFLLVEEWASVKTVYTSIKPDAFTEEAQRRTIEEMIAAC